MMGKKEQIRSTVGIEGMMIYTLDRQQVCIAYDVDGRSYLLRNEPAGLWIGREELFHMTYHGDDTLNGIRSLFARMLAYALVLTTMPWLLNLFNLPSRQKAGIQLLMMSFIYIFEFSILKGIHQRNSERGRRSLRLRAALNMALNAFEQKGEVPTLQEMKKASIYRGNPDYHMKEYEMVAILFTFCSIWLFLPTTLMQIVSIPILIYGLIKAFRTSLFGLLKITYVMAPNSYEMEMACDLIEFWFSISCKDSPAAS